MTRTAHTIRHKGVAWPVSPEWAAKHLDGRFSEMATWPHGSANSDDLDEPGQPSCWGRLWAILRKSDETFSQRTAHMAHDEVRELMLHAAGLDDAHKAELLALSDERLEQLRLARADIEQAVYDPDLTAKAKALLETLSPEEFRELRAAEAHVNVRNAIDFLLGRDLSEFEIDYIDQVHGQGAGPPCGCVLTSVLDDAAHARAAELHKRGIQPNFKTLHAHYPRKLCARHQHLMVALGGKGLLSDKLEHIHQAVHEDQPRKAEAA